MKIIPAREAGKSSGRPAPGRTSQEQAARKAAIEASQRRYIPLVCGHFSTLETDEGYSVWRPRKGVSFCENCGKWVKIKRPIKRVNTDYEQGPLF